MKVFSPSEALPPSDWPEQSLGHEVVLWTRLFWKHAFVSAVPSGPGADLESWSEIQSFPPTSRIFPSFQASPRAGGMQRVAGL